MNASSTTGRVIRSLRRSPGFVVIATVSMGVALGISTSVFAVMDAMTHPEPPFRDVGQLYNVSLRMMVAAPPPADSVFASAAALDGVERVARWHWNWNESAIIGGRVGRTNIGNLGPGGFDVLGARARIGRLFAPADYERRDVAVVTDMVWRRDFANRSQIGDATVQFNNRIFRIVGVLPSGTDRAVNADVFLPDSSHPAVLDGMIVRLKRGVTVDQYQPRLKEMNERFTRIYAGPKDRGFSAWIGPLRPDPLMIRDFHRAMVGAAVCILLIACANVAALLLARGMVKRRDYALRLALGAGPGEIGREVILEVALLALAGCVAGVLVTSSFVGLIGRAMPPEMEWQGFVQPQWSWRVLALAMGAVVASIAVAGGFPAWIAARTDPAGPLKEGAGGTTGRAGTRFRWLVMAELAMAMTLLMSTSLMLKSIRLMEAYEFGYPGDRLVRVGVGPPWREDSTTLAEESRLRQQALELVRSVPGVEAAILGHEGNCDIGAKLVTDRTVEGGAEISMMSDMYRGGGCTSVAPQFLTTVGIALVDGRDFEDGDMAGGGAVILDQKTALRLFPNERAVGRMVKLGDIRSDGAWVPVVGVAKDHKLGFDPHPEMGPDSTPTLYALVPPRAGRNRAGQPRGSRSMWFTVRAGPNVDKVRLDLARALAPIIPPGGRAEVYPWDRSFQQQLRTEQFLSLIFTLLGMASLLLGAAGLYSVISYIAEQRMREFAVRIALGATKQNVVKLVFREAFTMAIGGTAIGAGFGMWAAFLLWERMWGVYPVDAEALVIAEVTLLLVTMAACIGPALRAAKSNPLDVIRAA